MASIVLENVSVSYPIFNARGRSLKGAFLRSVGGKIAADKHAYLVVEALRDVSLRLSAGSRLAIFGPNGSGKSTLLRVLSGIMEPLYGAARIDGRVSALLDLSMGMDREATGYENIMMRAAFLGATLAEARELIPKVEEFSELGQYLALPMSAYSTGMAVRLSFSISTMMTPEILIMDEHVGAADAAFTQKATLRIRELADRAKIVVLATHGVGFAAELCTRAIVMSQGQIAFDGTVSEAASHYRM